MNARQKLILWLGGAAVATGSSMFVPDGQPGGGQTSAAEPVVIATGTAALEAATTFIAKKEATVLAAYQDPIKVWTACTGETKYVVAPGDIKAGARFTKAQCTERLYESMWEHAEPVIRCTAPAALTTGQKVAFLDLSFNMGGTNFCKLTVLLAKAKAGDVAGSCAAITRYVWAGGGKIDCRIRSNNCYGVVVRRAEERAICES